MWCGIGDNSNNSSSCGGDVGGGSISTSSSNSSNNKSVRGCGNSRISYSVGMVGGLVVGFVKL